MEHRPCNPTEDCPLWDSRRGCREDVHHEFWPRQRYNGVAKVFRELDENKVVMCRAEHEEIHAHRPPEVPSLEVMHEAINQARQARKEVA